MTTRHIFSRTSSPTTDCGVRNLATTTRQRHHAATGVCGAAVFVSAAAGAATVGGPPGPRTPAPAVPDLVAVVYEHRPRAAARPAAARGPVGGAAWRESWSPGRHAAAVGGGPRGDRPRRRLPGQPRRATPSRRVHRRPAAGAGPPRPAPRRPLRRRADRRTAGRSAARRRRPWCRSTGGRVLTRPIKGTRPATAAGRDELLASAEGAGRARDDRRPGAQRPGPGRPHRLGPGRRAVRDPALGRPVAGRVDRLGVACPTAAAWPTCCARSARAAR